MAVEPAIIRCSLSTGWPDNGYLRAWAVSKTEPRAALGTCWGLGISFWVPPIGSGVLRTANFGVTDYFRSKRPFLKY